MIVWAVSGALVVVLLALLAVQTPPGRRYALSYLQRMLAEQHVVDFSTDDLRYNLFNLSASLRNVRVGKHGSSLPPFAEVAEADVHLSFRSLLHGRYVIDAAHARGVNVQYVVAADGTDNLPRSQTPSNEPTTFDYLIRRLTVDEARVRYDNRATGMFGELPIPSITMTGSDVTGRHEIHLDAKDGTFRTSSVNAAIDRIAGVLDLGREDLRIASLTLRAARSEASAEGEVDGFTDPRLDLRVQATADLPALATMGGLTEPIAGRLKARGHLAGPATALVIDGQLSGDAIGFRMFQDLTVNTSAKYDAAARTATVSDMRVQAPWALVTGDAVVGFDDDAESRAAVAVQGLDAAALLAIADVPYSAATRVDARLDASWRGMNYRMATGTASAFLTPSRPRRNGEVPVGGRIAVTAQEGSFTARLNDVRTTGLEADGRVAVSRTDALSGQVHLDARDLAGVVETVESLLRRPRGSLVPIPIAGRASADAALGGSLQAPAATMTLAAHQFTVGAAHDLNLQSRLAYMPSAIRIDSADLTWNQAVARASGRIGLTGTRPLDLDVRADSLRIGDVLAAAELMVPVDGVAALNGRVAGTIQRPMVTASLSATDLMAYGEPFGTLTAVGGLDGRAVQVSSLALEKPENTGRLDGSGRYNLDSKRYEFAVKSTDLELKNLVLSDERQASATVAVNGQGSGTIDDPGGTLNLTATNVTVNGDMYGNVKADVVLANRQAAITADADRFRAHASATVAVHAPYATTVNARVDNAMLDALPMRLQTALTGQLSATLKAAGELTQPKAAQGTLTVDAFKGQWNEHPFGLVEPAAFAFGEQRLQVQRLKLAAEGSTVQVTGELPLTDTAGEGALDLESHLDLATLVGYVPDAKLRGNGSMSVTGHIVGTLEAIDPQLTLTVQNGELSSETVRPGLSNLTAHATVNHGEAVLDQLSGNWGTAMLEASARVPLALLPDLPVEIPRQAGAAALHASVSGLDVATIPGAPAGLTGKITAQAEGEGTSVTDLREVTGRLTFSELDLGFRTVSLAQDQPSTVALSGGVATIERLRLAGSAGDLTASGRVGLTGERTLDLRADGNVDLAVLSVVTDAVRASGPVTLALSAGGTVARPDLNGTIDLDDGTVSLDEPRIAADTLTANIRLAGSRITLDWLSGQLNGGTLEGSGRAALADGRVADVDLRVATTDFAFDAPLQLRSLSDSNLRLHKDGDEFVLDGKVSISDAGLTGDINFDTGLLAAVTARRQLDLTEERNPLFEQVRFNVNVVTTDPILIDNNLAKAEAEVDVRVVGTPYDTGLTGRLTLTEGGQLTLNERQYQIQRGVITFLDERRIQPSFDLELDTTVNPYEITLMVSGTPGETETTLTASPNLPQPDIMALLVTGRTLDQMRGEEYEVAREQVLSYLTGRIGNRLGRGIERATGLSEVRIEPNLIANETDPSARLTVGQDLTDKLRFVYSSNLTDSNDQIWSAQYDVTRRFQSRAVRQSDASYRLDFRHDVRFGGRPEPRREQRDPPKVGAIRIAGADALGEVEVRRLLRATEGEKYDYFAIRRGVERVERAYRDRGFLQSKIRVRRTRAEGMVALDVAITQGPPVMLQFTGAVPPSKIQDQVREQWRRGVFDAQRIDDGTRVLREWLQSDRHLQAMVHATVRDEGSGRAASFAIDPGPRSDRIVLVFEGAYMIDPDVLREIIDSQKLEPKLFTDPLVVTELLRRYYREQAYLAASIETPKLEFDGPTARVVLRIDEGPNFATSTVMVAGNRVYDSAQIVADLPLVPGESFLPAVAERSLEHIRDLYWQRGYNDVRSDYDLVVNRDLAEVQVTFRITEGPQTIVAGIDVEGNRKVRDQLVREELQITPQEPLDLSALGRARKALYGVGAFSIVDITREPVAPATATSSAAANEAPSTPATSSDGGPNAISDAVSEAASTDGSAQQTASTDGFRQNSGEQKPVNLNVNVRELQPFQIGYGASYDTERGVGGIFDIANYNSLGRARVIGLRSRYDGQLKEVRGYFSQPSWLDWPVKTTASIYYREETAVATNITRGFVFDRRGVSIQQEKELGNAYVWTYGYRYERIKTFTGDLTNPEELTVSPFTSTFTREQRDDILDATRGSFTSHAFSISPSWLQVDGAYLKYYGQYFHYFPLQAARRKPLTNELLRPRLVFATGVRLGLAKGMGGRVVPLAERFFAGGSTTLRAFEQNTVGPIGPDGVPLGGEGLFILNNEIRVPLFSIVDGVGFADIGNVFPSVRDFSFVDLRKSVGLGVRVRTPWFIVRGDLGFPLDRRPGERSSRFFFSIGQAF